MAPSCRKGHEPPRYVKWEEFVANMTNATILKITELPWVSVSVCRMLRITNNPRLMR